MAESPTKVLEQRIKDLEAELQERKQDVEVYKQALIKANGRLESLIAQLSQELSVAAQIQRTLVPTELPNIPGFEFSSKFVPSPLKGGDYFDIFEHRDRFRFGLIVASSSGYSMSALLLTVLLRLTSKMEAKQGSEPSKVVLDIAQELVPSISGEDHVNLFYGLVDRRSYELEYARCGEVLVFHQLAGSGELRPLEKTGPAIGKDFGEKVKTGKIYLNPRDRLIVCSEGVVKAPNMEDEMFGVDRLVKAILKTSRKSVHDARNEIIFQVNQFLKGRELPQDLTVLVAEVKDRVIKLANR